MANAEGDDTCTDADLQHFDASAQDGAIGEEGALRADDEQHGRRKSGGDRKSRHLPGRQKVGEKRDEPCREALLRKAGGGFTL